jgi:hypothetical protein
MNMPPVVSPQEWEAAHQELLTKEKELTRARDALAAERRRMPTERLVECASCRRPVREADADELGWRYWSDGRGLHLICALCAHRGLRPDAPALVGID